MAADAAEAVLGLESVLVRCAEHPISYSEKLQIEARMKAADEIIRCSNIHKTVVTDLRERLGLSYLPPYSSKTFLRSGRQSPHPISSGHSPKGQDTNSVDGMTRLTMELFSPSDAFSVVPPTHLMKCIVRRSKSSMRTTFRLYLAEETENGEPICKEENFLLGTRKVATGLVSQYYVWTSSDMKEWKDKCVSAKVTKSSSTFYANAMGQSGEGDGNNPMAVCVRNDSERLLQLSAAIVVPPGTVDEATLCNVVEVILLLAEFYFRKSYI